MKADGSTIPSMYSGEVEGGNVDSGVDFMLLHPPGVECSVWASRDESLSGLQAVA